MGGYETGGGWSKTWGLVLPLPQPGLITATATKLNLNLIRLSGVMWAHWAARTHKCFTAKLT